MDPIGYDANDVNLYRYVGNNSINELDPSGEDWWSWWGAAGGTLAGIVTVVAIVATAPISVTTIVIIVGSSLIAGGLASAQLVNVAGQNPIAEFSFGFGTGLLSNTRIVLWFNIVK
jgi:hypothetical protein